MSGRQDIGGAPDDARGQQKATEVDGEAATRETSAGDSYVYGINTEIFRRFYIHGKL